ncbi:MS_channel domain-containing protein [Cephalotus follicularis]|uniref:Mechanosensitive ion channel protein n=1 Tax=Cephalotus follicularis TaxID=3775 RepID=A0A1Q3AYG5_CEPFO|nr:MS_channel domain-containing protein [Cephalotus follicularis]
MTTNDRNDRRKVIANIDGGNSTKIWRESSYDFYKDQDNNLNDNNNNNNNNKNAASSGSNNKGSNSDEGFDFVQPKQHQDQLLQPLMEQDPPSKLINQFLHKQKASGEFSIDIDLEMAELQQQSPPQQHQQLHTKYNLPPVTESPSATTSAVPNRVSFAGSPGLNRGSPSNNTSNTLKGEEVLKCTSNAAFNREGSFNRKSRLLTTKTKSRLLDPPSPEKPEQKPERVVPRSGQMKSGFLMKATNNDEDEDDPLFEEDLPEEYKREKLDIWTLLQWTGLFLIVTALICTLSIPYFRNRNLWKLKLWKWEVLVFALICGRLLSGWVIKIVVFFIERNFLLRKRVLYFVYGLRKAVQNCLWLGLVLIAWHYLFDKKVERETNAPTLNFVTKLLVCFLVGTLLWLVKTLLIKVLASSFHVSTYFDRIQESLFNQYVIETLSGPPLVEIQKTEEEEEKITAEVQKLQSAGATLPPGLSPRSGRVIGSGGLQKSPRGKSDRFSRSLSMKGDGGITIDHLHKWNPKNISAWNMKRLMTIVRHGALSTLDEQIRDSTLEDESSKQIKSENEAKAAARKIFQNVAKQGSKFIYLDDLMRFLQEDESLKTMSLFEGASESKRISKSALKNWVVNAFRERRALALTLNDTKTAVNKLHHFVNILVGVIIVIIWLLILGIATSKFLLFVSSQLVVVAFIFGNTCKTTFESIIFLFVMHPFDVGDRCEIEGVQMVVEEMNILTTVFLRYDNQKIMYPNSVLLTKCISNYYRSPDMGDAVEFCVHIATPAEKIAVMKQKITSYIESKKDHWYPAPMIIVKDVEDLSRVRMAVWLTHRMNHQDMGEKWVRRSLLVEEMVKIFRELDIQYRLYPVDINVRTMPPVNSSRLPPSWTGSS